VVPILLLVSILASNPIVVENTFDRILPDDSTFSGQAFSEELYNSLPGWGDAAEAYGVDTWGSFSKNHVFSDLVLTRLFYGTEGRDEVVVFSSPVSVDRALEYSLMLTGGDMPDLLEENGEGPVFFSEEPSGAGRSLELELSEDGMVTRIILTEWTP
jgi:hypothetical protein